MWPLLIWIINTHWTLCWPDVHFLADLESRALFYTNMPHSLHPSSIDCGTCGRSVRYMRVKSSKNGNQGRLVAKCFSTNPLTGHACNFWHWYPHSLGSSPMSLPGSDDLEPISSPAAASTAIMALAPTANKAACAALGCNSTRLRKDCSRQRCKTHCMELGIGCASPAHKPSTTLAPTQLIPPLTFQLQTAMDPGPPIDPTSSHVLHPIRDTHFPSSAPPAAGPPSMPIHRSHMAPVFIEQWAVEQRFRAEKRSHDEHLLSQTQKVQQTVYVYLWKQDNVEPTVTEFQDGFIWPMFDINAAVLARIGLDSLPPTVLLNLFRPRLNMWTVIPLNHVVKLTAEDPRIFLKPSTTEFCKSLIIHTSEISHLFTGRLDIAKERMFMKARLQEGELGQILSNLSPTTKRSLSPSLAAIVNPPRKRFCQTAEPIKIPKPIFSHSRAATRVIATKRSKPNIIHIHDSDSESDVDSQEPFSSPLQRASTSRTPLIKSEPSDIEIGPTSHLPTLSQPTPSGKALWPGQLSTKEVIEGFINIEKLSRQPNYTVPQAFEHHFRIRFPSSTFYEHRDRWNHASQEDRDAALASNKSWTSFAESHPTSRAAVKAARKRQRKLVQRALLGEGVETIDDN